MKALISISSESVRETFFTEENMRLIASLGDIRFCGGRNDVSKEEFKSLIADRDLYVTCWGSPAIDEEILDSAPQLKLITHLGSTVAPFVCDEVWKRGVRVISAYDHFARSTAEGTIAYMLAALRRIPFYSERLKKDRIWREQEDRNQGLIYKTVGIVSYGGVGRYVVKMLQPFGVNIKVYDVVDIPPEEQERYNFTQCSLEEIFSSCDIISLHTPYNSDTHRLIDDRLLSMIKKGALLVNTARGEIVDQAAMTEHLKNGDFYAALDVYEKEPIDVNDPLLELDNILLMPHHGGVTVDLRSMLTRELLLESKGYIDDGIPLKNEISPAHASKMSKH